MPAHQIDAVLGGGRALAVGGRGGEIVQVHRGPGHPPVAGSAQREQLTRGVGQAVDLDDRGIQLRRHLPAGLQRSGLLQAQAKAAVATTVTVWQLRRVLTG